MMRLMRATVAALAVALALVAGASAAGYSTAHVIRSDVRIVRHDRIAYSAELYRAARHRAVELARAGSLDDHRGMGWGVYREHWSSYGEVLAWHAGPASGHWFVRAWLASPTHRAVLLGRWTHVGASCRWGHGNLYCVAVFAR